MYDAESLLAFECKDNCILLARSAIPRNNAAQKNLLDVQRGSERW